LKLENKDNRMPQRTDQREKTPAPWSQEAEVVLDEQHVDNGQGLTPQEVKERRERFGSNRLRTQGRRSAWLILFEQFKNIIIWLLLASSLLSFLFGEWIDGVAVLVVIVINTMIGFFTELRAVRSMEALREMSQVDARVRRDGNLQTIPADQLVPGDIVVVDGGDIVTADLRLFEASKLQANESALTGESEPVSKQIEPVEEDRPLAERENMLFKGTAVTRGSGAGVVVFTGMETELGQISELVAEAEEEHTPLEKRLDQLSAQLVWFTLGIIVIVAITGIVRGREFLLMIETAVALAVAAVPEGLPIVATIALARGMRRMAENNALINRLASVETLGGTNVICADKTGTLTENRMTVTKYLLDSGEINVSGEGLETEGDFFKGEKELDLDENPILEEAIRVGVLCTNAELDRDEDGDIEAVGEPVETALLIAGLKADMQRGDLTEKMPEAREVAFDPEVKMMATYHEQDSGYFVAVKGAPEAVLESSTDLKRDDGELVPLDDSGRQEWLDQNERLASRGLRLLALAAKEVDSTDVDPYENLIFLGLVALLDPPREEVRDAIQDCKRAGIQVAMVTGDQAVTARNIAEAVGLTEGDADVVTGRELQDREELSQEERDRFVDAPIFARVSPKQKLDLIAVHQEQGAIVAMTGDGVNDAPALKKADIGVAMGQRGTQVAREAADMVLEDDAFSSIVLAVRLGRVIFNNIRRFVLYLISCNVSEILVVFLATMVNLPLPILPLQILFLNLVTDVFPALALGVSKGDPAVMRRPPRDPDEAVLMRRHWLRIGGFASVITISVLASFVLAFRWLGMEGNQAVTISFLTLAFAQLWHVFNMRDLGSDFIENDVFQNLYVWGAVVLCVFLLLAAVYLPPLANVLKLVRPGLTGWGLILGFSVIPWVVGQIYKSTTSQS
jgi:Ca2+-transporting ATPase